MADKYIATAPLYVGHPNAPVLAHNVGDEVPEANIERNGWQDGVEKAGTKAAEEAQSTQPTTKAEWVDFAVQSGMDEAEAKTMTKEQLAAQFGG